MHSTNSILRRALEVFFWLTLTASAAHGCLLEAEPDPCGLQEDLVWAMNGGVGSPPHPNWENRLDWRFNRWLDPNTKSQNWGPLAHAIAFWRLPPGKTVNDNVQWWNTFFNCQNDSSTCALPGGGDTKWLKYMKGIEILSVDYDAPVTTAVASVHYWAKKNNNQDLADKARRYLRITFAMYALAAGPSYGRTLVREEGYVPDGTATKMTRTVTGPCNVALNGNIYFKGPFVAAASMRANPQLVCTDDRATLLSRALQLSYRSPREDASEALLVNYLEDKWRTIADANVAENVYALDPASRALAYDHIQTGNQVTALKAVLTGVRTSVVYHFLAWETADGQVRATIMEKNLNGLTEPVMAEKYTYGANGSIREVHILIPNTTLRNVPQGVGRLLPNALMPNWMEATSEGLTVGMDVPVYGMKYHLVLSPTQEPELMQQ